MSSLRRAEPLLRPVSPSSPADDALLAVLAGDGLPAEVAALQWRASEQAWAAAWPSLRRSIVVVDGVPAGRLYVGFAPGEVRVVDVTLLPAFRGRGLGTAVLRGVLAEAGSRVVSLQVALASPARRLYERLGFDEVSGDDVRAQMEWRA